MSNNLASILQLADNYTIVDHKVEIDEAEHISVSSSIYTDGDYKYHVDTETGFIRITELKLASYICYIDRQNKVYLCIYRNIHDNQVKIITDSLISLHEQLNQEKKRKESFKTDDHVIDNTNLPDLDEATVQLLLYTNGLVDINNMKCDECGSTEFKDPILCNDDVTIEFQCNKCNTIFRVIPSRFYMLHSKTVFTDTESMGIKVKLKRAPKPRLGVIKNGENKNKI